MQFRLRDLLVATVVLAGIGALVLPAIQVSREAARRTQCSNNLKQLGLGIHNYHDTFKRIPPGSTGMDAAPRIGWRVRIIPFLEHSPLYDQLNMNLPDLPLEELVIDRRLMIGSPDIKTYKQAAERQVNSAMCPSDRRASVLNGYAQSSYSGNLGSQNTASGRADCQPFDVAGIHFEADRGSVLFGDTDDKHQLSGIFSRQTYEPITFDDLLDGTSYTFAAGEILGDCHPNETGWWDVDGAGNAHASTSVPLNTKRLVSDRSAKLQIAAISCRNVSIKPTRISLGDFVLPIRGGRIFCFATALFCLSTTKSITPLTNNMVVGQTPNRPNIKLGPQAASKTNVHGCGLAGAEGLALNIC